MKTAELTEIALDYAVAQCEGGTDFRSDGITWGFNLHGKQKVLSKGWAESMSYHPSTNWTQGGSIIEREGIGFWVSATPEHGVWCAAPKEFTFMTIEEFERTMMELPDPLRGSTPLIAAMRCYVSSKLGDEIEIPEELK